MFSGEKMIVAFFTSHHTAGKTKVFVRCILTFILYFNCVAYGCYILKGYNKEQDEIFSIVLVLLHAVEFYIYPCITVSENNTPLTVWGTGSARRQFIYSLVR